jgi:hypothetical protein
MLLCWAGMALAVLAKGLIGLVLPGAVLVLYSCCRATSPSGSACTWQRPAAVLRHCHAVVRAGRPAQSGTAALLLRARALGTLLLKTHHREGAWYYFLLLLVPGILPWLGARRRRCCRRQPRASAFQPKLLLLIWAVFITFFFSYSSSKLPGYILPIFPALALLIAAYLEGASRRTAAGRRPAGGDRRGRPGRRAADGGWRCAIRTSALLEAYQPWVLAAAIIAAAGGALALLHARHLRRDLTVLTMAVAGFPVQLILAGFEPYGKMRAGKTLALKMLPELQADTPIYSVSTYEQSMTFYLHRHAGRLLGRIHLRPAPAAGTVHPTVDGSSPSGSSTRRQRQGHGHHQREVRGAETRVPCAWWRKTRAAWSLPICNEQNHK